MLKINKNKALDADILTENQVFDAINRVNPELANLIQDDSLAKDFLFLKVNYPFGEKIIHNKEVFFPLTGGGSISFNDPSLPDLLAQDLSYVIGIDNPVGMILNRESEFYLPSDQRIVSYMIIKPGQIFGFAHIIDAFIKRNQKKPPKANVSIWNLDAGARMAFILPKISENQSHENLLNAYSINIAKPEDYTEHCDVFRALNAGVNSPWKQSVLYFPRQFLDKLINDPKYSAVYQEMSGIHRSGYNIWHSTYAKWDSDINYVFQKTKANTFSAYAVNMAKHIYLIVAGGVPGFIPTTDESMLPKELIEKAYNREYGLNEYWPITMQPKLFTLEESVYCSLNLPTLIHYNPETFKGKTIIELLYEVMMILCKSQEYILNQFEDRDSHLYETATQVLFSFYHDNPNPNKYGDGIKNSALLPEEDARFNQTGFIFPVHSHFVRGCIKIEPINS